MLSILTGNQEAANEEVPCTYMHTHVTTLIRFQRTPCGNLSWTVRILIYDFSLAAATHRPDSVPSCIIINSSIKCMFDSQNGEQYSLHSTSAAAEGTHTIFLKSRILCVSCWTRKVSQQVAFPIKCANRFWRDFTTAALLEMWRYLLF